VKPDWWKLEPMDDPAAWRNIEAVIARHDPYCHGVVLLGLSQPVETLIAAFEATARAPVVKGFAVGRTIFGEPARGLAGGPDRRRGRRAPAGGDAAAAGRRLAPRAGPAWGRAA
jgi:myo-inositol catabolism protein IolC